MAINEHSVRPKTLMDPDHILGRHTVHILPHASAWLNPSSQSLCLPVNDPAAAVLIPLSFNNTRPQSLRYSITAFGTGDKSYYNVSESDLTIPTPPKAQRKQDEENEEFDDDWSLPSGSRKRLAIEDVKALTATHALRVTRPGVVRLQRVLSPPPLSGEVPFSRTEHVLVASCPYARMISAETLTHRCAGEQDSVEISVDGVPPLRLEYSVSTESPKTTTTTKTIEGIAPPVVRDAGESVQLNIPLNVTLTLAGTQSIRLVSVVDSLGNRFDAPTTDDQQKRIAVHVPATVNFFGCSPDKPQRLLKGSKGELVIRLSNTVGGDGSWKIGLREPGSEAVRMVEVKDRSEARGRTDVRIPISGEGEYTLVSLDGQYCQGSVLAPLSVSS